MKEKSKRVGLLANRYGLLTVLGLGYSFLGTSAYGAAAPVAPAFPESFDLNAIRQDAKLTANSPGSDNAQVFNGDGILSAAGLVENLLRAEAGAQDRITIVGTPAVGNTVQVIFNETHKPENNDYLWGDRIADTIPDEVYDSFTREQPADSGDALEAFLSNTIHGAYVNWCNVLDVGAAKKQALAIVAALEEAKGDISSISSAQTDSYEALKGIFQGIGQNHPDVGIQQDTETLLNFVTAWGKLVAAAGAAGDDAIGNSDRGIASVGEGQAGGGALAHLVNGANGVGNATHSELHNAIVAANNILQGIGEDPNGGDSHPDVRSILKSAYKLQACRTTVAEQLNSHINADNFPKALEKVLNYIRTANSEIQGILTLLGAEGISVNDDAVLGEAILNQINTLRSNNVHITALNQLLEGGVSNAPFAITPVEAADDAPPRTFVLQLTQDNLSGFLDLANPTGSSKSILINATNIRENENVAIVFDAGGQGDHQSVDLADIIYDKLTKNSNLLLVNKINENVNIGCVRSLNIDRANFIFRSSDTYNFLTAKIATQNAEFGVICSGNRYLKKLILGASESDKVKIVVNDTLEESSLNKFNGNYTIKKGSLWLKEGIQVLENSKLKCEESLRDENDALNINYGHLFTGGDITIPEGTTLTLALKSISPLDIDNQLAFNGTGAGKVGVLQVKGTLAFDKVLGFYNDAQILGGSDVSFKIKNNGDSSFHNYIVLEGGTKDQPCEIKLNGCNLTLADEDADDKRVLAKINTQDASQLILVKEESYAKITGSNDGTAGTLTLGVHGEHANKVALIRLEDGASITLDPVIIAAGDSNAIVAGRDGAVRFLDTDTVTLAGNIIAEADLTFVFGLTNRSPKASPMLNWPQGTLNIPANTKVGLAFDLAEIGPAGLGRKQILAFLAAYQEANPDLQFINFESNSEGDNIADALSTEITGPISGVTLARDGDKLVLNFENADVPSFGRLLGGSAQYLSNDFAKLVENAYENGARTAIERGILSYLENNHSDILPTFSKTTTEEKNRMTLTLINSVRETVYSKLGGEFFGDKHYNVWVSGFGDVTRNGSTSSYKMNCDIFGFTTGIDWRVNNNLLIGVLGGYGKAKAKYKGEIYLSNDDGDGKCNLESYFGGIYGMWDEFVEDICVKFSLMAGHGKYNDEYAFPFLNELHVPSISPSHKGHWLSGNIDCTYKHWNLYGFNVGPWVSLSTATIHQKSNIDRLERNAQDAAPADGSHFERKVSAADRRSIETTVGVAADYDFSSGILELAMGYKHEFRKQKKGKVSLYETYNDGTYKIAANGDGPAEFFEFDPFNVSTGKDSFVARASWNMQFGNFGLSLGSHTQLGNHFKDIAGSIIASYSF
ncbi:MAG: autotransporter outer membrane beta-barrel domain-containing protein [Puniceicoccales bacterium]|jgi:outer membrane autotransporter protein|nr:autotransporter outer membrane beta-barrel domain-containing protein [Puniceicoccales bacterium]